MIDRLSSYAEVLERTGDDAYARWSIDPALPLEGGARDGAVAWTVQREHYSLAPWLNAVGRPAAVADLVTDLLTGRDALAVRPRGITVPHGTIPLLEEQVRPPEHGDWNWWWSDRVPAPEPAEHLVTELPVGADPHVRAEVAELLRTASPTASADAEEESVRTWCGIRDTSGRLVACGADRPMVHGPHTVPHLASIATHPDARGRGYGGAVTAWLIRHGLIDEGADVVTLGMYADNAPARSVYERLGLRSEHRFTSGNLPYLLEGDPSAR